MTQSFFFRWDELNEPPTKPATTAVPGDSSSPDLYAAMMRAENPAFGSFSACEMRELFLSAPCAASTSSAPRLHACGTRRLAVSDRAFLGRGGRALVLWRSGATLRWTARRDGFPSGWHARLAAGAAYAAAREWNAALQGRARLRYTPRFADACFQVRYGGDAGDVIARAFAPADWQAPLNEVAVFRAAFAWAEVEHLRSAMLHELGHVLGLRHEHARDGVAGKIPPEDAADGPRSVLWGMRNPSSVMAYYRGQEIQQSDADAIRSAYDELWDGRKVVEQTRFGTVEMTVRRVDPS